MFAVVKEDEGEYDVASVAVAPVVVTEEVSIPEVLPTAVTFPVDSPPVVVVLHWFSSLLSMNSCIFACRLSSACL